MRILEVIKNAIAKIWKFSTLLITIVLLMAFVLFVLFVFMPDNVLNAIEIIKGIFKC